MVQETLIAVMSSLPKFEHRGKGSFRGWMKTIARRCFAQLVHHYTRNPVSGATKIENVDLACEKLVDSFDQEAQKELFNLSAAAVKERVAETTWRAFEMSAIEGLPGIQVAESLGIQIATVYVHRGRVQRMIDRRTPTRQCQCENIFRHPLPRADAAGEISASRQESQCGC